MTISQPSAILVTMTSTAVSCKAGSNGQASVTVTGGTGAFDYLWSNAAQTTNPAIGLSAGAVTVTVSDANNCPAIGNITITEPFVAEAMPFVVGPFAFVDSLRRISYDTFTVSL